MKNFIKKKELWMGLTAGLVLSYFFVFGYGWCEAGAFFAWSQLEIAEQYEFGLQIIGGAGAFAVFGWTIWQWYLSKKLELEIKILENFRVRIEEMKEHEEMLNKKEGGMTQLESEFATQTYQEVVDAGERIVTNSLSFTELRFLNKKYGSPLIVDLPNIAKGMDSKN